MFREYRYNIIYIGKTYLARLVTFIFVQLSMTLDLDLVTKWTLIDEMRRALYKYKKGFAKRSIAPPHRGGTIFLLGMGPSSCEGAIH